MSVTDAESSSGGLGKRRKRLSRIVIIAFVLVAVLIVGAVTWWTVNFFNNEPERTKHSPISIMTNWEFRHENGIVGGSGTESDPYVIADWDIDASTAPGIRVMDTDAHFIIRNCYVHDGSPNYDGILLLICFNGTLSNNICSNNLNGITLTSYSNNNSVTNNTCISNSHDGIALCGSYNTISTNNCSSNGYDGIYLVSSANNSLLDNNCSSNGHDGISLDRSSYNEVVMNLVSNNAGYGVNISSYSYPTHGYGSNNHVWTNVFIGNNGATSTHDMGHVQACDNGIDNRWNVTDVLNQDYGNYWSDWKTPDLVAPFNRVDLPYDISGSAGAKDYHPLTFDPRRIFLI